jgi:hypothetical protein
MVDKHIFGVWQVHQAELFPRLQSMCLDYCNLDIQSYTEAMFAFITPTIQTVHVYIDRDFCQLIGKMRTMAAVASRSWATTLGLHQTFVRLRSDLDTQSGLPLHRSLRWSAA